MLAIAGARGVISPYCVSGISGAAVFTMILICHLRRPRPTIAYNLSFTKLFQNRTHTKLSTFARIACINVLLTPIELGVSSSQVMLLLLKVTSLVLPESESELFLCGNGQRVRVPEHHAHLRGYALETAHAAFPPVDLDFPVYLSKSAVLES